MKLEVRQDGTMWEIEGSIDQLDADIKKTNPNNGNSVKILNPETGEEGIYYFPTEEQEGIYVWMGSDEGYFLSDFILENQ
jgi:hypothetical protein